MSPSTRRGIFFAMDFKEVYDNKPIHEVVKTTRSRYERSSFAQYRANSIKNINSEGISKTKNLLLGHINRTKSAYRDLYKHLEHKHEVDAAVYFWNNPQVLRYQDIEALGQNKDMSKAKNIKNIEKKRRRNFIAFGVYNDTYNNTEYEVNTAIVSRGYEQIYFLKKKKEQNI